MYKLFTFIKGFSIFSLEFSVSIISDLKIQSHTKKINTSTAKHK